MALLRLRYTPFEARFGDGMRTAIRLGCMALALGAGSVYADVPRIIFDSDMSSDWDDVGDAAVLHGLATLGEVNIIGMMVSSHNGGTPLCMDAINTYYGKPDIPIGVRPDIGGVGLYAGQIASEFPHDLTSAAQCPQAAKLYRQLLANSPDKSVIIATTGFLNNLEALLKTGPDEISPLSGADLVKQKVKTWACAGGAFPEGSEFNFAVEKDAAKYVIDNWPTAVTYTPFNVGQAIYTAGRIDEAPVASPIRKVYVDIKNQYPYPSWGQIAIYQAVRGSTDLWGAVNVGRNNAEIVGGYTLRNYWTSTPDPTGADDQAYLTEKVRTPVRASLDALMMLAPNTGAASKPGEPTNLHSAPVSASRMDLSWVDNAYNETGFVIERGVNGVYQQIATVGANVTTFSDPNRPAEKNVSYRVKAVNNTGASIYSYNWYYSGWTDVTNTPPPGGALYTSYQHSNLRWANPGDFRPDHLVLNNDSQHGKDIQINVDAGALGSEGNLYVYFFYQDANNWYRFNFSEQFAKFEKRVAGTTSQIGEQKAITNIGDGSELREWMIRVNAAGNLTFTQDGTLLLQTTDTLSFDTGKIGLGGYARNPVWENFHFAPIPEPAGMVILGGGALALRRKRR